jgi:nitrate/TMAO reductase-like tetraheme cytochrome c subunit
MAAESLAWGAMPGPKAEPNPLAVAARPPRRTRLFFLARNYVSLAGFFLIGVGLVLLVTAALFIAAARAVNPYFGIVSYLILPVIFAAGLLIVPLGMWRKHRRLLRQARVQGAPVAYPAIDLNEPRTRTWVTAFVLFTLVVVLPVLGVTSYFGYHYTDSVSFCAQVCHSVMEPEGTAHAHSPHARVTCAECHIGPGASWFVKSKITGASQVIAVLRNSYPRPIPPAITELRPARETCEDCHWPSQFFGEVLKPFAHYSSDEQNTRRVVRTLLKVGGQQWPSDPTAAGIHVHMLLSGQIQYVATDPDLQEIPWVRYDRLDGTVSVYRSDGQPAEAPRPEGTVRNIDCMDCHNRGAHHFPSPQVAVDAYLENNRIDRALPFIKREAVALLVTPYPDTTTAEQTIEQRLTGFYYQQYPQVWKERSASVSQAATMVKEIYRRSFFPGMKVSWRTYPENVGHLISPGCFRCHDGLHVGAGGRAISSGCSVCHTVMNPLSEPPDSFTEGQFEHSMSLVGHDNLRCDECHTGGVLPSCVECHASGAWLPQRGKMLLRREAEAGGP